MNIFSTRVASPAVSHGAGGDLNRARSFRFGSFFDRIEGKHSKFLESGVRSRKNMS